MFRERETALEKLLGNCSVKCDPNGGLSVAWPRETMSHFAPGSVVLRLHSIRLGEGFPYTYFDRDSSLNLYGYYNHPDGWPHPPKEGGFSWLDCDLKLVAGVVGDILGGASSGALHRAAGRATALAFGVVGSLSGFDSSTPVAEQ